MRKERENCTDCKSGMYMLQVFTVYGSRLKKIAARCESRDNLFLCIQRITDKASPQTDQYLRD